MKKDNPFFVLIMAYLKRELPEWTTVEVRPVRVSHDKWDQYLGAARRIIRRTDVNESLFFHGTGMLNPVDVLNRDSAQLNPMASSSGRGSSSSRRPFYGQAIYLAKKAKYVIGGRYATMMTEPIRQCRITCPITNKQELYENDRQIKRILLVSALLGNSEEMGTRVDEDTKQMFQPNKGFDSVRAGPHRPGHSGPGSAEETSSRIAAVYSSEQCMVRFVIDLVMDDVHR